MRVEVTLHNFAGAANRIQLDLYPENQREALEVARVQGQLDKLLIPAVRWAAPATNDILPLSIHMGGPAFSA